MPARPPARPRRAPSFRRLPAAAWAWLAACLLALLPGPAARGDIQQPPKPTTRGERELRRIEPPPFAVAQSVHVLVDSRVDIILESRGQIGKTVDFLIRTPPAHGTLAGPPRQLTRSTAAVTYLHRAADGPQADSFTFAVQAPGTAVSAAAAVSIDVAEAAPSLAVTPAELDFGAVNVGDTTGALVTLENQGGGAALGRLLPPAPWEVDGPADYRLAHGERRTFRVVFHPGKGGAFIETLRFPGAEARGGVRLLGIGVGPASAPGASPAQTPPLIAVPDTTGKALPSDAAATPPPMASASPAAPVASPAPGIASGPARPAAAFASDAFPANTAQVGRVEVRAEGTGTVELAWTPPTPLPRAYRVEMRYLFVPSSMNDAVPVVAVPPRVEWRAYSPTDFRVATRRVTARLHGLNDSTIYALRVVSIDAAGHAASPSPVVFALTNPASGFWRVTPLKVLSVLLLLCLAFYLRRRIEERRILRALDERHLASVEADETFVRRD